MLQLQIESLAWAINARTAGAHGKARFQVAFRLGPFLIAQVSLNPTIVDLGDAAVLSKPIDLARFRGDELFLRSVPDSLSLAPLFQDGDALAYPFYRYDRCWVRTEGDFEEYLSSFSKTSRKGLRRRIKQLETESGGELDIRYFADSDIMYAFHADARTISAKTFQEKLVNDGIPASDGFRQEIREKAADDRCYGTILYLDDEPVSYLYCERKETGWQAVYGGFDPAFAKLSPGTIHLVATLKRTFEDADSTFFDFGPGQSEYKQFFATDAAPSADVLILERTLQNRVIIITHLLLGKITDVVSTLAEKLRLKTLLRQKLRGR